MLELYANSVAAHAFRHVVELVAIGSFKFAALRRSAFSRMLRRRCSPTTPHSLISSKDLKQPRQTSKSFRQQFRMQGDGVGVSISFIQM